MPSSKKTPKKSYLPAKVKKALHLGPLSEKALVKKLGIPQQKQKKFYQDLKKMAEEGTIRIDRKKVSLPKKKLLGKLSVHPRGFGFVIPQNSDDLDKDVFIPRKFMYGATDGDLVEVELFEPPSKKGYEGKISQVVKRGKKNLVGTVLYKQKEEYYLFVPSLKDKRKVIIPASTPLKKGDRILLKVEKWGNQNDPIFGCFLKSLGSIFDPSKDVEVALEEFQIPKEFDPSLIEEAEKFGNEVQKEDQKNRVDHTKLLTVTIDPETAKDFDDALSLEVKDKKYHLYVHIADVAHYVKGGSPLDLEAFKRANSTYFPGICIPMIPQSLSNGLCSLKPEVIRLTSTVKMSFSFEGELLDHKIYRSFIRSDKRFTYEEAFETLKTKTNSPYLPLLENFVELCLLLKKKRTERGSIDFALPDAQVMVDEKGVPTGIKIHEYDITHQLVEEFMLKANEVVAKALSDKGLSLIFRIHEEPSLENFEEFFHTARILGFFLPAKPALKDIQKLFIKAKGSSYFHRLSVAFIRSMKLALYSQDNIGHYGLALEHYTHYTSPIRRYSDLIISRLLFEDSVDVDRKKVAQQCSEKERNSMKAEQSVTFLKKLRLLKASFEKDPDKIYTATITKIKSNFLAFELEDYFLESSLSIADIGTDYFEFHPQKGTWEGRRTGEIFSYGDSIEVCLQEIDLIYQSLTFEFLNKK